jgi:hypothetical protein
VRRSVVVLLVVMGIAVGAVAGFAVARNTSLLRPGHSLAEDQAAVNALQVAVQGDQDAAIRTLAYPGCYDPPMCPPSPAHLSAEQKLHSDQFRLQVAQDQ